MKLDQEQNFRVNAIVNTIAKQLPVDQEKMYEALRAVLDAKSTGTRIYALEDLLRTVRDSIEADQSGK
jgi:hypothetical protein